MEYNVSSKIQSSLAPSLRRDTTIIAVIAAVIYLGSIASPPHLMDDVDAVQAQISRTMLQSGDWVTARLNGVAYLEKSPLGYWLSATSYRIFGVHDWAGRLPLALSVIGLCLITQRFGAWAFDREAGFFSGLVLSTCVGLFLFTRIVIPDAILTLAITCAMWSFARALDLEEQRSERWPVFIGICFGVGLLLKGLIAIVFPIGAMFIYTVLTRQLLVRETWRRLRPFRVLIVMGAVAIPWYVLATLKNPPYFDFTIHSARGEYRGFFWFYFINEHVLRFLGLRYPRDYNTVPRLWFWLLHIVWLFPWSFYGASTLRLNYRPLDRAGRTRLLAVCWIAVVMIFFSFSTTQEYYSMPIYPALALLLGCGIASGDVWVKRGSRVIAAVALIAFAAIAALLWNVWTLPAPGDIASALVQHPEMYTLSLGHMGDLTLQSFAYLKLPLAVAGIAALVGAAGVFLSRRRKHLEIYALALMMVIFVHAARIALMTFDPYLGSKPLADALVAAPPGNLIEADAYYAFSSVFFYTNRSALLWNGREANLEYGSYAPGAPNVFIDDESLRRLWYSDKRFYLLAEDKDMDRIEQLISSTAIFVVKKSGGKSLITNQSLG